jgi:phosphoglycolate phosphatase-like HAD superfamily hydrolase
VLVLFDIDGTLLKSQHAGVHAMLDAFHQLHPDRRFSFDGVDIAGRLDTLIYQEMTERHGVPAGQEHHETFRHIYSRNLESRLADRNTVVALEGVHELVRRLATEPGVELGLLTGNYPATGRLKVKHAGLDPDLFRVNAFAMDGETRRDLPPVALQRYRERHGSPLDPAQAVIIGDTPKDVDCALHNGCRVLGVATGEFSVQALLDCGAHMAVDKLSPIEPVLAWLLSHRGSRR